MSTSKSKSTNVHKKPAHFDVRIMNHPIQRLIGLLAGGALGDADVVLFPRCNSVHTFGMSKDIDIAFINSCGVVIKSLRNLSPNCLVSCKGARAVLERFSDTESYWLKQGEQLSLVPAMNQVEVHLTLKGAENEDMSTLSKCEF